ncbi:hypothetical protein ORI89_06600 [Sphingobacterium sp. UT-1RO-CII-1]|uniref:Crp/Fnr family transcriptional regulator n=1 Tax=Sphingobacterium sp. UT-1RO-CII-1 TaxID=2995225 RepID=UPI00227A7B1B|nr:hypothetical protein [Sphingobacterium sp. UT-1RO-CII-1]MCY4779312.1 hypothetical protein [Sphingobacterium sp. UT-1RO-CII-1]
MKELIDLLAKKYEVLESSLNLLLNNMTKVAFENHDVIADSGNDTANYYIISAGIWRSYRYEDGDEITLWFERYGDIMYSEIAPTYSIESVGNSEAYMISKAALDELCLHSHEISNLIRILIERFYFDITRASVDFSSQLAKERYLAVLERDPELFQLVPLKYIASFLGLTPQSLSRIRREIFSK